MYIFLDTETTGLEGSRMIELCYWIEGAHEPTSLRCKPPIAIELDAMVVHGITQKDIAMLLPFREQACYAEIKELLEDASNTIIGHNISFDIAVLAREGILVQNFLCTKELSRTAWPEAPSYRLQHLRYWLNLEVQGKAHSAVGDVMVLRELWSRLQSLQPVPPLEISETNGPAQIETSL